jgi:hypothetical protein
MQALAEVHKIKAPSALPRSSGGAAGAAGSRPDFSPEFLAVLQTADMDGSQVRQGPPEGRRRQACARNSARCMQRPLRKRRAAKAGRPAHAAINDMDRAMGLTETKLACTRQGNALVFGITESLKIAPANTPVLGDVK